jgi:hypothetical protein
MLQENFENLVKAPETSEAYFNFDGNTRAIEVRKYSHVPDSIVLNNNITSYSVENNDVFKDFLTPVPYINLSLPTLPNDIVEVNVKKIIAKSDALKLLFKNKLTSTITDPDTNETTTVYKTSTNMPYGDVYKLLLNYQEDYDYVEYDTIYKLPIRKNIGTATYVIETVVSDVITDNLDNIITLKLRNDLTKPGLSNTLTYKLFDDTIEKPLQVGDELINYDGTGKVVIKAIKPTSNTIEVKVVNGEYLNFVGTDTYDTNNDADIHDLSKLRFHAAYDFEADKVLKLPLEEDQYVFIAVAALNSRMNVQSSWGVGTIINTYNLTNNDTLFKTYYDENVKNIGDVLLEMSNMITAPITSLSQDTFTELTSIKPVIKPNSVAVMQINKHLNNSTTVKNIRDAYNQKKTAEISLAEVQAKINDINEKLATISFSDTSGIRSTYTAQLSQFNRQKNELLAVINSSIDSISLNVNQSEIPIENAKYRIRGFYVPTDELAQHVIGLQVQYRYKNVSTNLGNAVSMNSTDGNNTYIYSDWNILNTRNKLKIASCVGGKYIYNYEDSNEIKNEPSYNQIDIPISQGETVDIRIKLVYDYGQPYITMTSDWSDILNVEFPEEFTKDVPILTIIEENNNDIETNRFNSILETLGVNTHINDTFMDQNLTYFHKSDNIASGFYTNERKVIPLKDKLQSMVNDIAELKADIQAANGVCHITAAVGNVVTDLAPNKDNIIVLEQYDGFNQEGKESVDGAYIMDDYGIISTIINLSIANTSENTIRLYSLFPGNRGVTINKSNVELFKKEHYCTTNGGVYIKHLADNDTYCNVHCYENGNLKQHDTKYSLQTQNQFITFRTKDAWTGEAYYNDNTGLDTDNVQNASKLPEFQDPIIEENTNEIGLLVYPYLTTKYGLCIDSDDVRSYTTINPGEEIVIPIYCEYRLESWEGERLDEIKKTLSFDLRTSLYTDPVTYSFSVVAKLTNTNQDTLLLNNKRLLEDRIKSAMKYNHTIK